jgi:hypothetical protein
MIPGTRASVVMMCHLEGGLCALLRQVVSLLPKPVEGLPAVAGPLTDEVARAVFGRLQNGKLDRKPFGAEFNRYLSEETARRAARRLKR